MSNREYFPTITASYVFFRREDEVLLLRRKDTGYQDGMYGPPAGHIEKGELALAAAVREAKEETGISLDKNDLRLVHIMHRRCGDHERVGFWWEVKVWSGEPRIAEPHKSDQMDWYDLSALPEEIQPHVRQALAKYQQDELYSEFDEPSNIIFS